MTATKSETCKKNGYVGHSHVMVTQVTNVQSHELVLVKGGHLIRKPTSHKLHQTHTHKTVTLMGISLAKVKLHFTTAAHTTSVSQPRKRYCSTLCCTVHTIISVHPCKYML